MSRCKAGYGNIGHQAGDRYIIEGCNIICNIFKRSPVFRIGGDEFVAISKGDDFVRLDQLLEQVEYINQRNLIYTGITRAKKVLVLAGTKKALGYAVRNVTVTKRNTMLSDRIRQMEIVG